MLASKRKIFDVDKPKNIGDVVHAWRVKMQLTDTALAEAIGTTRQNIANLEGRGVKAPTKNPKFLPALATYMGYASSDELRALKPPPARERPAATDEYAPSPVSGGHWRRVAQTLAQELGDAPVNAEKFVAAVDVLAELIADDVSDDRLRGVARRHLRLVA